MNHKLHRGVRWLVALILMLTMAGCGGLAGQEPQKPIDVTVAIGGQAALVYLPTTLAQELGYYKEEGLNVTLQDFSGGSKALQALIGGSTHVVSGFYDHTIQMAAEGKSIKSFVTMLRYPGMALVVSPGTKKEIKTIADLKGATVGVSAPGSSTHLFVNYLLSREGLTAKDISVTGVGTSADAVAATESGQVDATVMVEPALTQLIKRKGDLTLLADTRTAEGVKQVFGTDIYPAAVFYSTSEWLEKNPEAARRLARAITRTLKWIQEHSPEDIAAKMPATYRGDDPAIYIEALRHTMPTFSTDGMMPAEGAEAVKKVLSLSVEKVRDANVDTTKTYTNEFLK